MLVEDKFLLEMLVMEMLARVPMLSLVLLQISDNGLILPWNLMEELLSVLLRYLFILVWDLNKVNV